MLGKQLSEALSGHTLRHDLIHHPFFDRIDSEELTRGQVATFLGQWWHPLHYFPVFLSRLIAVTPPIAVKTSISKILYQELGEGDVARAHEVIYIDTMTARGFSTAEITEAAPLPATARLVSAYAENSGELLTGLGFLYGTEVADLAMVSGIGRAVRKQTGAGQLDWVDIHVQQEPEHVARANDTVTLDFSESEERAILTGAESMWRHWIGFFDQLERRVFASESTAAAS